MREAEPYLELGDKRQTLPPDLAPDELTPERAEEILAQGSQERDLAVRYRAFAAPLLASHPQTAVVLEAIAMSYDAYGRSHDVDSALVKEGAR